ncbi:protein GVQW3-like [Octopus sinensis]|uniref:Protein GVQW3-like n=1 Tax=Octopus sinensis TaxID=2607531 RepID=A0A6P7T0M5_9MOLL|nr:protein GVQW3-like [Octopus sinensis]
MENRYFEIRSNIKFLVKLEWKGTQIIEAVEKVYGTHAPKKTTVYKWILQFKEGRDDFEDDPHSGRPTSKNYENIEAARNLIEEDQRITVNQIAMSLDISYGLANSILHDNLGLSKLSARWVPKALRPDQQNLRSDLSLTLLNKIEADEEQLSPEMKLGFTSMILSPKNSQSNGSHTDLQDPSSSNLKSQLKK